MGSQAKEHLPLLRRCITIITSPTLDSARRTPNKVGGMGIKDDGAEVLASAIKANKGITGFYIGTTSVSYYSWRRDYGPGSEGIGRIDKGSQPDLEFPAAYDLSITCRRRTRF